MVRVALNRELQFLHNILLDMARSVDEMFKGVIRAFENRDKKLAQEIIKFDDQIDYYDHMINVSALEILALQQPVAKDLRTVVSALDISRNLERLADQAVNIAEMVLHLAEEKNGFIENCKIDLLPMAKEALYMLEQAINAFVKEDVKIAREVINRDEVVDQMKVDLREKIESCLKDFPESLKSGFDYLLVVENLERVADLACNIGENIIFVVEGKLLKGETPERISTLTFEQLEESLTFQLLKRHARLIIECLSRLPLSLEAYFDGNEERLREIARDINEIEKEADKVKTNVRGHLPKGLILPVEKFELFMYLKEQDALADLGEALLKLLLLRKVQLSLSLKQELTRLLEQSLEPISYFEELVAQTLRYLSYWDAEARERAKKLVRSVRHSQFVTEELAFRLKETIYKEIKEPLDFFHISKIVDVIALISTHMENTADLLRAMIAK
ncbi:MAG: phosphate signaling complex protein PhoU [Caldimicrobium sp.]|nr:phosphate signaling complex protein PhoU [Caldimicrobium sp.]MCX7874052.1 phosphate signaling complex protein PhoU [Caldimicrobium sp.]MDW8093876.1 phosphate signaling complex protein PhoU [Caldimicrobium sp.]